MVVGTNVIEVISFHVSDTGSSVEAIKLFSVLSSFSPVVT